jgi:hypothetical protein
LVNAWFADFIEGLLDDAITTGPCIEEALCTATVKVAAIAVVTFFHGGKDAIPAEWRGGDASFDGTRRAAPVPGCGVAVITLLGSDGHPVTAEGARAEDCGLQDAIRAAAVFGECIAVIALLGGSQGAVTADGECSDEECIECAGCGAAISRSHVAVIALLSGIDHPVPAGREETIAAAVVGQAVGIP